MKIAGRKNDGAWFRTNRAIHALDDAGKADLKSAFVESCGAKGATAFADLSALAAECGVSWPPEEALTATAWLERMISSGIPRQVWQGRLSFTTYSKVAGKYKANYQSSMHFFAKDMRRFMKYWLHGKSAIADLTDSGVPFHQNPGGIPDSVKGT